jgi:protein-L-isoaspartate(D-aspartate) O-methyltransferase
MPARPAGCILKEVSSLTNMSLVNTLIQSGWLKTPRIIDAFQAIKREDFMPDDSKELARLNEALPIGYGQTISQPLVVAFMIEKLQPQPGEKILDIGSGSGWTTALLAQIVGPKGKVIAIEIVLELKEFGEVNVSKYNFIKSEVAQFVCADGSKGYPKEAPFDKILCSAEAEELPQAWKEQLRVGGQIVTPIGNSICVFRKKSEKEFEKEEHRGFVFVPLIKG